MLRKKTVSYIYFFLSLLLISNSFAKAPSVAAQKIIQELSDQEQKVLKDGHIVYHKIKLEKFVWPEIIAYSIIEATALQSVAIFFSFGLPNRIRTKIECGQTN